MTRIATMIISLFKKVFRRLVADRGGNFAMFSAVSVFTVMIGVGASIDLHSAYTQREKMQQSLDAGVLAAVRKSSLADQKTEIENIFLANFKNQTVDFNNNLSVVQNADTSITATLRVSMPTAFLGVTGVSSLPLAVKSSAIALTTAASAGPCIYVLGSSGQDVLINSGANVQASTCEMDVASTANPAFIMNSGSTLNFSKFCVKGTQYIKNGGTINNMQVGCTTQPDPYAGALPEPSVPACTDSGTKDGSSITVATGVHCNVTFNGSPTITFSPGLHIISGRMIINSGSTVIANGVTFYFPDTNSEIRANGNLTFTGTAPTSGTYKGILMFEKTSDAANNANKVQYIFNGSNGETLQGIIHLPNRNVTYNSTTNTAEQISMVVNQMIINSANWKVEPYDGAGSSSQVSGARLTQ